MAREAAELLLTKAAALAIAIARYLFQVKTAKSSQCFIGSSCSEGQSERGEVDVKHEILLTGIGYRSHSKEHRRNSINEHFGPAGVVGSRTSDQCGNNVSLSQIKPSKRQLHQRHGEDDEGLDQVAASFLLRRQRSNPHESDLLGQVPHDGEDGGGVYGLQRALKPDLEVTPTCAVVPKVPVVVAP